MKYRLNIITSDMIEMRSVEIWNVVGRSLERVVGVIESSTGVLDIEILEGSDARMATPNALDGCGNVVKLCLSWMK